MDALGIHSKNSSHSADRRNRVSRVDEAALADFAPCQTCEEQLLFGIGKSLYLSSEA